MTNLHTIQFMYMYVISPEYDYQKAFFAGTTQRSVLCLLPIMRWATIVYIYLYRMNVIIDLLN